MGASCFNKGPLICITAVRSNISASVVVVVIRESTWRYDVSDFWGQWRQSKRQKSPSSLLPYDPVELSGNSEVRKKNLHTFLSFSKVGGGEVTIHIRKQTVWRGSFGTLIYPTSCSAASSFSLYRKTFQTKESAFSLFPLSTLDSPLFSLLFCLGGSAEPRGIRGGGRTQKRYIER